MIMMQNGDSTAAPAATTSTFNSISTDTATTSPTSNSMATADNSSPILARTIALNHAGIRCMESNNTIASIKLFTAALTTQEKLLKTKLAVVESNDKRRRGGSPNNNRTEANIKMESETEAEIHDEDDDEAISDAGSQLQLQSQSQSQPQFLRSVSLTSHSSSPSDGASTSVDISSSVSVAAAAAVAVTAATLPALNVDELFVRSSEQQHYIATDRSISAAQGNDNNNYRGAIFFRDPIRLPPLEELIFGTKKRLVSTVLEEKKKQDSEEGEDAFSFLSTCHAFNLAIANHQRGIELFEEEGRREAARRLEAESQAIGSSSSISTSMVSTPAEGAAASLLKHDHFNRAGRLYELTMRLEGSRLKTVREREDRNRQRQRRQQQQQQQQQQEQYPHSTTSSWYSPKIVLACINNLAHLHHLLDNAAQSQRCYRQLRSTVTNMWLRRRQHQRHHRHHQQQMVSSSSRNDGNDYLQVFWTSAYRGLSQHYLPSASPTPVTLTSSTVPVSNTTASTSNNSSSSSSSSDKAKTSSPSGRNAAAA